MLKQETSSQKDEKDMKRIQQHCFLIFLFTICIADSIAEEGNQFVFECGCYLECAKYSAQKLRKPCEWILDTASAAFHMKEFVSLEGNSKYVIKNLSKKQRELLGRFKIEIIEVIDFGNSGCFSLFGLAGGRPHRLDSEVKRDDSRHEIIFDNYVFHPTKRIKNRHDAKDEDTCAFSF